MKARQYINMMGMAAAVLLSSCVKDTLYDTPHPDYGKIAVTADWSACGEGINIPATWTVTHGSPVNFSGSYFHVVPYGVNDEGFIEDRKSTRLNSSHSV